ncbi:uncharacterized protein LOC107837752 isoform X1 [Poecilia formosa]|uniref:uncharacterized protein LOC107837752 isoform X1 n=1 Tax=Poecilia formosa TaxID=48698 RepID=UPI0007B9B1B6|nr:PREDICTED: uncharacterized protein LOC107837752 isoform X1 [Poecilia formosa]
MLILCLWSRGYYRSPVGFSIGAGFSGSAAYWTMKTWRDDGPERGRSFQRRVMDDWMNYSWCFGGGACGSDPLARSGISLETFIKSPAFHLYTTVKGHREQRLQFVPSRDPVGFRSQTNRLSPSGENVSAHLDGLDRPHFICRVVVWSEMFGLSTLLPEGLREGKRGKLQVFRTKSRKSLPQTLLFDPHWQRFAAVHQARLQVAPGQDKKCENKKLLSDSHTADQIILQTG